MRKNKFFLSIVVLIAGTLMISAGCSKAARLDRHLNEGLRLAAAGKYDEAEIEFKNVLQTNPSNPLAIGQLGIIYFKEGRLARAVPYLLQGRQLQPDNLELRIQIALAYLSAGKVREAREEALYVLEKRPADPLAPIIIADAARTPEDVKAAQATISAGTRLGMDKEAALVASGLLSLRSGDLKSGESRFIQALAFNANSVEAHALLGGLYRAKGDLKRAELEIGAAAKLAPPRSSRKIQYAQFKFQQGDNEAARAILEEITRETPDFLPASIALAEIDFTEKKYGESSALLAKVAARETIQPDAILLGARIQLAKGESAKAVGELERMVASFPQSAPAFYYLGVAYLSANESSKAAESLAQAIKLAPGYPEAVLLLSNINIARNNLGPAGTMLKALVQQRPDLLQAWILLADVNIRQNNFAGAREVYRQAEKSFPKNPQISVLRGVAYLKDDDLPNARASFLAALDLSPNFGPAEEQLINLEVMLKNYPAAMDRLQKVLARDPKQSWAQLLTAKVYSAQGLWERAEETLHALLQSQPDATQAYFMLAGIYSAKNEEGKAISSLREAVAKDPKNFQALIMIALLSERLKNFAEAKTAYEQALAIDARSGLALNNLAYLYSERFNEIDKAYETAQRARAVLPLDAGVSDTLGWIQFKRGQWVNSLGLLRESAGKLLSSGEAQYHLAWALAMTGNEDEARSTLERGLRIDPGFEGNNAARELLALLQLDVKTADPSVRAALEKQLSANPGDPVIGLRLAAIYERDGELEKAQDIYEKLQRQNGQNYKVTLALIRVYSIRQQLPKALELAKALRKQFPDNVEIGYALGRLAFKSGDFEWAFSLLQDAAPSYSSDPEFQYDLALAAYYTGHVIESSEGVKRVLQKTAGFSRVVQATEFSGLLSAGEASSVSASDKELINSSLKQQPDNLPALVAHAKEQELDGNRGDAMATHQKIVALYPMFLPAYKSQSILAAKERSKDPKDLTIAQKARAAFPNDTAVTKAYGILLYLNSDLARSMTVLKEAAAKTPEDPETQFYLGRCQVQSGQGPEGKASLADALRLGLREPLRSEAVKAVEAIH